MQFFYHFFYKLKEARVKQFTQSVCAHMLYIYNYFSHAKSHGTESLFIKEAIGMLDHWEQTSDNIYKHKPSGVTIEIKKDARIEPVTKKILAIEIPSLIGTKSQLIVRLLTEMSAVQVDDYFKNNKIAVR